MSAANVHLMSLWPGPRPARTAGWDGRIDNGYNLRVSLGVSANTGDGALVLEVYRRWGVHGFKSINGDWSVVIEDQQAGTAILACDYLGVRPLFYHVDGDQLLWSTRLEVLAQATGIDAVDEEYVAGFLTIGGHPHRTPYVGIAAVPAGHVVQITRERVRVIPYWELPVGDTTRYRDERCYDERIRTLFREAVAARLDTSAPVVAELSGGLDSSSVVCMANSLIQDGSVAAPRLATVSYVHNDSLDVPFIRAVEVQCGIQGTHLSTHDTRLAAGDDVGCAMPEGWGPLHRSVASVARGLGAKVVLTGQAGDLVMGNWFDDSLQVAGALRRGRCREAVRDAMAWSRLLRTPVGSILARGLQAAILPAVIHPQLYAIGGLLAPQSAHTSLVPKFLSRLGLGQSGPALSTSWMAAPPERRKHFQAFAAMRDLRTLRQYEPGQELEYTHPFAHRPLVEFLLSVPAEILCRPGAPRLLMRRALGGLWPEAVRRRRSKSLFSGPWIEALRPLAQGLLRSPCWRVVERGWVDRIDLTARLGRLIQGLECNEPQLRQVVLLEYWLRNRERFRQPAAVLKTA